MSGRRGKAAEGVTSRNSMDTLTTTSLKKAQAGLEQTSSPTQQQHQHRRSMTLTAVEPHLTAATTASSGTAFQRKNKAKTPRARSGAKGAPHALKRSLSTAPLRPASDISPTAPAATTLPMEKNMQQQQRPRNTGSALAARPHHASLTWSDSDEGTDTDSNTAAATRSNEDRGASVSTSSQRAKTVEQLKTERERRQEVARVLQLPYTERTAGELFELYSFTRQFSVFKRVPVPVHYGLVRQADLVTFDVGDLICRQGDPGDAFYVILSGSVGIVVEDAVSLGKQASTIDFVESKGRVATLTSGMAFGDLALIEGKPRNATVFALKYNTECIQITKNIFDKLLKSHQNEQLNEKVAFLQQVPFLRTWTRAQLVELSYFFHPKTYPADVFIDEDVFFVVAGTASVIRRSVSMQEELWLASHAGDGSTGAHHRGKSTVCNTLGNISEQDDRNSNVTVGDGVEKMEGTRQTYTSSRHVSRHGSVTGSVITIASSGAGSRTVVGRVRTRETDSDSSSSSDEEDRDYASGQEDGGGLQRDGDTDDKKAHANKNLDDDDADENDRILKELLPKLVPRASAKTSGLLDDNHSNGDTAGSSVGAKEVRADMVLPSGQASWVVEILGPFAHFGDDRNVRDGDMLCGNSEAKGDKQYNLRDPLVRTASQMRVLRIRHSDFCVYVVDALQANGGLKEYVDIVRLRRARQKLPGTRTSDECELLLKHYNAPVVHRMSGDELRNDYIEKLSDGGRLHFCQHMRVDVVNAKHIVSSQGEEASAFFVLLSGRASMYTKIDSNNHVFIRRLKRGSFLGELALYTGSNHCVSVVADEVCEFAVFSRDHFAEMIRQAWTPRSHVIFEYLETLSIFSGFLIERLAQLTHAAHYVSVQRDVVLMRQGICPAGIFFLMDGTVDCFREISASLSEVQEANVSKALVQTKVKPLRLTSITTGEHFGEECLFWREVKQSAAEKRSSRRDGSTLVPASLISRLHHEGVGFTVKGAASNSTLAKNQKLLRQTCSQYDVDGRRMSVTARTSSKCRFLFIPFTSFVSLASKKTLSRARKLFVQKQRLRISRVKQLMRKFSGLIKMEQCEISRVNGLEGFTTIGRSNIWVPPDGQRESAHHPSKHTSVHNNTDPVVAHISSWEVRERVKDDDFKPVALRRRLRGDPLSSAFTALAAVQTKNKKKTKRRNEDTVPCRPKKVPSTWGFNAKSDRSFYGLVKKVMLEKLDENALSKRDLLKSIASWKAKIRDSTKRSSPLMGRSPPPFKRALSKSAGGRPCMSRMLSTTSSLSGVGMHSSSDYDSSSSDEAGKEASSTDSDEDDMERRERMRMHLSKLAKSAEEMSKSSIGGNRHMRMSILHAHAAGRRNSKGSLLHSLNSRNVSASDPAADGVLSMRRQRLMPKRKMSLLGSENLGTRASDQAGALSTMGPPGLTRQTFSSKVVEKLYAKRPEFATMGHTHALSAARRFQDSGPDVIASAGHSRIGRSEYESLHVRRALKRRRDIEQQDVREEAHLRAELKANEVKRVKEAFVRCWTQQGEHNRAIDLGADKRPVVLHGSAGAASHAAVKMLEKRGSDRSLRSGEKGVTSPRFPKAKFHVEPLAGDGPESGCGTSVSAAPVAKIAVKNGSKSRRTSRCVDDMTFVAVRSTSVGGTPNTGGKKLRLRGHGTLFGYGSGGSHGGCASVSLPTAVSSTVKSDKSNPFVALLTLPADSFDDAKPEMGGGGGSARRSWEERRKLTGWTTAERSVARQEAQKQRRAKEMRRKERRRLYKEHFIDEPVVEFRSYVLKTKEESLFMANKVRSLRLEASAAVAELERRLTVTEQPTPNKSVLEKLKRDAPYFGRLTSWKVSCLPSSMDTRTLCSILDEGVDIVAITYVSDVNSFSIGGGVVQDVVYVLNEFLDPDDKGDDGRNGEEELRSMILRNIRAQLHMAPDRAGATDIILGKHGRKKQRKQLRSMRPTVQTAMFAGVPAFNDSLAKMLVSDMNLKASAVQI